MKLEKAQVDCLRRKNNTNSSSAAIKVGLYLLDFRNVSFAVENTLEFRLKVEAVSL